MLVSMTLSTLALVLAAGDAAQAEYEAFARQYDTAYAGYVTAVRAAKNDADQAKAAELRPDPLKFLPRFSAFAETHPDAPAAVDALTWIASHAMFLPEGEKALTVLAERHSQSDRIIPWLAVTARYGEPSAPYEALLRTVLKSNRHPRAQAAACLNLAAYLKMAREKSDSNLIQIALNGPKSVRPESLANLQELQKRGLGLVADESEALFQRVIVEFADERFEDNYPAEAGKFAKGQLFELKYLLIGRTALELDGTDTAGKPIKLADYRGQVVVLDFGSHRNCGVCRAMYPHLRATVDAFADRPVAFIGINSGDDLEELKRLTDTKEITWRVVYDGAADQGPIFLRWVIDSMPTIYVLDSAGVIRNKGFLQPAEISATVEMLLREMAEKKS